VRNFDQIDSIKTEKENLDSPSEQDGQLPEIIHKTTKLSEDLEPEEKAEVKSEFKLELENIQNNIAQKVKQKQVEKYMHD